MYLIVFVLCSASGSSSMSISFLISGLSKNFVHKRFEQKAGNRRNPGPDFEQYLDSGSRKQGKENRVGVVNKRLLKIKEYKRLNFYNLRDI